MCLTIHMVQKMYLWELSDGVVIFMEAPPRLELGVKVLQTSALPLGYGAVGASDEARTRYLHLGKVALYQMSYTRMTL